MMIEPVGCPFTQARLRRAGSCRRSVPDEGGRPSPARTAPFDDGGRRHPCDGAQARRGGQGRVGARAQSSGQLPDGEAAVRRASDPPHAAAQADARRTRDARLHGLSTAHAVLARGGEGACGADSRAKPRGRPRAMPHDDSHARSRNPACPTPHRDAVTRTPRPRAGSCRRPRALGRTAGGSAGTDWRARPRRCRHRAGRPAHRS